MNKQLKRIKQGIKDEKDGINYYSHLSKKGLTKEEKKHIQDALKDEKEHLKFLEQDKKTIIGKMRK
jgi:rubrerythrin